MKETKKEPITPSVLAALQAAAVVRVVDDDAAVRDALQCVLEIEGWRVQTFESAEDYLRSESPSVPGVVVMDVRMPGKSGLETQMEMAEREWSLPIIFLTGHGEVDMAVMALKRGAVDFLQKPVDNERFLEAVAEAVRTQVALDTTGTVVSTSTTSSGTGTIDWAARWETLTEKEKTVVRLVAQGLTNRQTAERLGNAVRTVEVHRANAYRKLDIRTGEALDDVVRALQAQGLL